MVAAAWLFVAEKEAEERERSREERMGMRERTGEEEGGRRQTVGGKWNPR
ncbi:hypothetical protein HanRHA438_Chr12g0548411 [Helianthus annuus]|nr:hypothetical protein HanRHA438_Chr12g0548411 [Helianthus annuus]